MQQVIMSHALTTICQGCSVLPLVFFVTKGQSLLLPDLCQLGLFAGCPAADNIKFVLGLLAHLGFCNVGQVTSLLQALIIWLALEGLLVRFSSLPYQSQVIHVSKGPLHTRHERCAAARPATRLLYAGG